MSSIKNSKKNDAGNLLPHRKPRIGRYIALAIILHVFFIIVYIYFTHKEPGERSEESAPPVKISPVPTKKKELIRHQAESTGTPSFRTAVRPPMPPRLKVPPDTIESISLPKRSDSPPINTIVHSTKPGLIVMASLREVFSDRKTARETQVWPEKQIAQRDMRLAPFGGSPSPAPSAAGSARQPVLLAISDLKKSIGVMKLILPALPEGTAGTAAQKRMKAAEIQRLAYPEEDRLDAPAQHRPVSQSQARLIPIGEITKTLIFSKESIKGSRDWKSQKRPPVATSLPFPKSLTANLKTRKPSNPLHIGKPYPIIHKVNLSRETIRGAVRFETTERAACLSSEMVWQKESEFLPPLSGYAPLPPELPRLIEDHLSDAVKRLIRPALQEYVVPVIRIQAKNITYSDLGLESEGTKFLSGMVKTEIEKLDGVKLLDPADVSMNPQVLIGGEMWDDSEKIKVGLWALDRGSGRRISTVDATFRRTMIPDKVEIQPPSGENLSMIQRMVELIKQIFPRGGDFQLGIWPDKGLDAVYVDGERLIVHILSEKDAYLHVDYYQIDGTVVHLLPSQLESNYIKAGASYVIGDPKGVGYEFKVSKPFGEELLVVVASQKPLGTIANGMIEPAEPYIKRLAESLGRQRKEISMSGSHYIILTKERDT